MFENGEVKGICPCCLKGKDAVYWSFGYLTNVRDAHIWSGGQCYPSPVHGRIVYWGGGGGGGITPINSLCGYVPM